MFLSPMFPDPKLYQPMFPAPMLPCPSALQAVCPLRRYSTATSAWHEEAVQVPRVVRLTAGACSRVNSMVAVRIYPAS